MLLEVVLIFAALLICWWFVSPNSETKKFGDLIPGPYSYPIIGNLFNVPLVGKEALATMKKLWDEHGPVVRLWAGNKLIVMIFEAEDIEVILKSSTIIQKSELYRFLHPWIGTGLLTSTGLKWRARRKAITPTFHFKILENFMEIFSRNGKILVERLESKVGQGYFDVQSFVVAFTLDVICETAMGIKVNAQTQETNEYRNAVVQISDLLARRFNTPLLYNDFVYYLSGLKAKEDALLKIMKDHTLQVVKMKTEELMNSEESKEEESSDLGIKRKVAFLELLLRMRRDSDPAFQSDSDICEEVETFMFEGHDTTTSALCFAIDMLAAHPDYQAKLYEEISASFSKDKCDLTMEELNSLKYLDLFLKEVVRFSPSVPAIARQITENVRLNSGYTVPAGAMLSINVFRVHRNERWFSNPTVFNPDNFLPEAVNKRHPFAYIPFSAGPRNCIGQKFVMLEMKLALVKLILNFEFQKEPDFDVIFTSQLVLDSANGHRIKLLKRN